MQDIDLLEEGKRGCSFCRRMLDEWGRAETKGPREHQQNQTLGGRLPLVLSAVK